MHSGSKDYSNHVIYIHSWSISLDQLVKMARMSKVSQNRTTAVLTIYCRFGIILKSVMELQVIQEFFSLAIDHEVIWNTVLFKNIASHQTSADHSVHDSCVKLSKAR